MTYDLERELELLEAALERGDIDDKDYDLLIEELMLRAGAISAQQR